MTATAYTLDAGLMPASPSTAPWRVDPARAVLLVHDMQEYFVRTLPPQPAADLVRNVTDLVGLCREAGIPVAYTAQPGRMTRADRGLLADLWGRGMTDAEEDRRIVASLAPKDGDRVYTKWRYSGFFRTDLERDLRDMGRDQLILCGVYAHIGVLATAMDAYSRDVETFLVADALADFDERWHRIALDQATECCSVVRPLAEALA